jgi:hypothetical protein
LYHVITIHPIQKQLYAKLLATKMGVHHHPNYSNQKINYPSPTVTALQDDDGEEEEEEGC